MHLYANGVIQKIMQSISTQTEKLDQSSRYLASSVEQGGVLHVLGSGHSHMIAEEMFYRAGGPVFVNPILDTGLMLHDGTSKSTRLERLSGYAETIMEDINFRKKDVILIVSNSGRNILPVEAALYAKEMGVFTLSISSFAHSHAVESRHPSGSRLSEITDIALDNCGEVGDALLKIEGLGERYGPTSSAVGIVLVQTLLSMTIENLVTNGVNPPLMRSANLDGSDEINREIIQKYVERIPLLK